MLLTNLRCKHRIMFKPFSLKFCCTRSCKRTQLQGICTYRQKAAKVTTACCPFKWPPALLHRLALLPPKGSTSSSKHSVQCLLELRNSQFLLVHKCSIFKYLKVKNCFKNPEQAGVEGSSGWASIEYVLIEQAWVEASLWPLGGTGTFTSCAAGCRQLWLSRYAFSEVCLLQRASRLTLAPKHMKHKLPYTISHLQKLCIFTVSSWSSKSGAPASLWFRTNSGFHLLGGHQNPPHLETCMAVASNDGICKSWRTSGNTTQKCVSDM